jgi:hypothetical protein
MRAAPLERQIPELVDDQELRFRVVGQALGQLSIGLGLAERSQQCSGAR